MSKTEETEKWRQQKALDTIELFQLFFWFDHKVSARTKHDVKLKIHWKQMSEWLDEEHSVGFKVKWVIK